MIFLWERNIDPYLLKNYFKNDLGKLLFFDIETTGLGFTKSNIIFLVGTGIIINNKFLIKQFVLANREEEFEMYKSVIKEFRDKKIIITYNGEKFDLPLFTKRLSIHNKKEYIKIINSKEHIDLLKIVRRKWRKTIGNCSLGNVEKKLLNIHREEDLPGFLVPSFFKLYLQENDILYLNKILKHNRQDILSLYYLLENIIREDL